MTNKFLLNHRVLWLLIPLLMLFNNSVFGTGTATLPFEWTVATDNSSTISDPSGVTENSIGRYTSNYPYRLKFDAQGDYLQIDVDAAVDKVIFHVKMVGGTSTSKFKVQGCTTSSGTYSDVEEFTISGSSNTTVVNCTTSVAISSTYRHIRIIKSVHGSNVGLGYVKITKAAPAVKYTVTYNAEGGTCGTASATESTAGGGVSLPSASPSSTCSSDGWAFYGWATAQCTSSTPTAPAIVGKPGDTYYPTSNITLHAVYAIGEYAKETSAITSGSKYLIVGNTGGHNYIMKSSSDDMKDYSGYTGMEGAQVDETSSGKYHAAAVNPNWCYTIEGSSGAYYIRDLINNSSSNYLDLYFTSFWGKSYYSEDSYTITVSAGIWSILHNDENSYLGLDDSDLAFFAYDASMPILLYKAGTINYYSNPTCCTPLGSINGSFF